MRPPRVLASAGPQGIGSLLIVTAGLHGNEPAGVTAALEVGAEVEALAAAGLELCGRFVALAGNRRALAAGERYLDRDLNRLWRSSELARADDAGADDAGPDDAGPDDAGKDARGDAREPPWGSATREHAEMRELRTAIEAELAAAGPVSAAAPGRGAIALLDLHSTSAPGAPFCIVGDDERTAALAEASGAPVLLGLAGTVPGTLVAHFGLGGAAGDRVALCFEGGENTSPATVRHHAAAIRSVLVRLGIVPADAFPTLAQDRAAIAAAVGALPRRVEVLYRHALARGERFAMLPGFTNFQEVRAGELLATSDRGGGMPVRAPFGGLLVMPRYQGRGEDGFFLGRAALGAGAGS